MSDHILLTDAKYQTLVHGYLRQMSLSLKLEMPDDLIEIVNLFFPKLDAWDSKLTDSLLTICEDGKQIRIDGALGWDGWQNAYGTQRIAPSDYVGNNFDGDRNIIELWKIRLDKLTRYKFLFIGIIPESKIESVNKRSEIYFCDRSLKSGYGLYGRNNELFHDAYDTNSVLNVDWKEGGTIEIIMYFKKGNKQHCCLGYQTGQTFENAYDDLDINLTYRFAVALWDDTALSFI